MASSDVVVLAEMAGAADKSQLASAADALSPLATASMVRFKVSDVLKGGDVLGKVRDIDVLYFGSHPKETSFLVFGVDPQNLAWSTPTALAPRAVEYVKQLPKLPESGAERLRFFQEYFEDADPLLAQDCYDEFAKAPYAEVIELKDQMHHDKLMAYIQDANVSVSHRRLYLTMLGACGQPADVPVLEGMIRSEDNHMRSALDALIACYINLKGPDGLPLVEELFLKNKQAEYTHTYSAIMALRFHGQETNVVSKQRLAEAMRHMLERPQLADLVIPDLARWEDWSVMNKLVDLFKNADEDSAWVRVPVIQYLKACPLDEAKTQLEELAKIDPDAVKRASTFFPLGPSKPSTSPSTDADDAVSPSTDGSASAGSSDGEALTAGSPASASKGSAALELAAGDVTAAIVVPPLRRSVAAAEPAPSSGDQADALAAESSPDASADPKANDAVLIAPAEKDATAAVETPHQTSLDAVQKDAAGDELRANEAKNRLAADRRWVFGSSLAVGGGILAMLVALFTSGPRGTTP